VSEEKAKRSRWLRNTLVGVAVLLVLYALAGFLVLPWWLQKTVPEQLDQTMGWQASVEDISVNPFALTLEARGFEAVDGTEEPVVSFDRLAVNLSFFQLLTGVVGFQNIYLEAPDVRVDLLEDYSVNFARDWREANPPEDQPEPPASGERSEPVKLYFDQVAIDGGNIRFRDFTQGEVAEFQITPLDLSVSDLATWPQEEGNSRYSLVAAVQDQSIEWYGTLELAPLSSEGRVELTDIRYDTLAHFLAPVLPWQVRSGTVSVESRYRLFAGDTLSLDTAEGRLIANDVAMALSGDSEEPSLSLGNLEIAGVGFDLTNREATVGMVSFGQLSVAAHRNAGGEIDWLASLPETEADSGAEQSQTSTSSPFRWSIQGLELNNSRLQWQDDVPPTPANIELTELSASIGGLSHRLDEPVSYRLASSLASGGRVSANGQLTPRPFNFEAALSGSDIALAAFEPYVQMNANLEVVDGSLGFDGNLDLDDQTDPMTGTFSGTAEVAGLNLRLPDESQSLLSWESMRLAPIEFNVNPARLEIGTVVLAQPEANIVRLAEGQHNVQTIAKTNPDSGESASAPEPTDTGSDEQPPFIFRIGELQLQEAALAYTDRTLEPPFNTTFDALSGSISGISNVPPQQGQVNLQGQLAGVAPVEFTGTLGALGTEDTSNLKLTMQNLSLPVLSPYFGRYVGYAVDSGKMELNLDYSITGTQLDASNTVILDQMKLGQNVASDQAVNAPVKLGLALLTDRQGVIEVDLPVSGDLADPQFSVGQVVMRAFVNLLAKAAASPFTMLGSVADLAGFSSEELGHVAFEPGTTVMPEQETAKLSALASALQERPELLLNVRGAVAPEADGLALLKERMAAQGEETSGEAWEQARQAYLAGERQLPPEALGKLASQRALEVRRILEDTHGVAGEQLFLLDASRQAELTDNGQVIVPFTLDVR